MKLGEAVKIGSALTAQAFRDFYKKSTPSRNEATCFLGAALVGINQLDRGNDGAFTRTYNTISLKAYWPWLMDKRTIQCPGFIDQVECPGRYADVFSICVHLNDYHQWSRLAIAEYIEKFEPVEVVCDSNNEETITNYVA